MFIVTTNDFWPFQRLGNFILLNRKITTIIPYPAFTIYWRYIPNTVYKMRDINTILLRNAGYRLIPKSNCYIPNTVCKMRDIQPKPLQNAGYRFFPISGRYLLNTVYKMRAIYQRSLRNTGYRLIPKSGWYLPNPLRTLSGEHFINSV